MIFDYEKEDFIQPDGKLVPVFRPILGFHSSKRGSQVLSLDGLLDSGADMIIFPTKLADFFKWFKVTFSRSDLKFELVKKK